MVLDNKVFKNFNNENLLDIIEKLKLFTKIIGKKKIKLIHQSNYL